MEAILKKYGKLRINEPLSKHTTFKIGGPAKYFITITETSKLIELLQFLDAEGVSYLVFGGGSNMLASDEGFDGVVIDIATRELQIDGTRVVAQAGCITVEVAQKTMQASLTGFEWGVGVPGTIGGALRGNAGAMGREMKDSVTEISIYKDGEVEIWDAAQCDFGYRSSRVKHEGGVVLSVTLQLEKATDKSGMQQALQYLKYRNTTQPQGFASTGCIFKNADIAKYRAQLLAHFDEHDEKIQQFLRVGKISAGWLVEQVGMKGAQVGGALVSDRHGNFIVSDGSATAQDVRTLIDQIKEKVFDAFGISLEEEIYVMET